VLKVRRKGEKLGEVESRRSKCLEPFLKLLTFLIEGKMQGIIKDNRSICLSMNLELDPDK